MLTEAQRAWVKFRDSNCEFEVFDSRGGTGFMGYLHGCLEQITAQRANYLQERLKELE